MVKNCGSKVHQEIASREFMELFKEIVEVGGEVRLVNVNVKRYILGF
jgi:hypothetical protein